MYETNAGFQIEIEAEDWKDARVKLVGKLIEYGYLDCYGIEPEE